MYTEEDKNMVKAIMHGCNGHMGRVITDIIKNTEGIELVAGIDKYTKVPNEYPVLRTLVRAMWKRTLSLIFECSGSR